VIRSVFNSSNIENLSYFFSPQLKDETFLCKLANFDVYSVIRPQKSPKPFLFAIKSTDNLAFFENTADYLHRFSCKEKDGLQWMANILLARVSLIVSFLPLLVAEVGTFQSYLLYRERLVFSNRSASVPRAGSRRAPRPGQHTLVTVDPPNLSPVPAKLSFEPGSLLAKRGRA
jgi:growth factor receptor-bound protein 14